MNFWWYWQVTDGERVTLTLWFSRNSTHDEDKKLISHLSQIHPTCGVPSPASSNMYLYSPDQAPPNDGSTTPTVFDISCARIYILGFGIYSSAEDKSSLSEPFDLLSKPLQLVRGDELFDHKFWNILHALQVYLFLYVNAVYWMKKKESSKSSSMYLLQVVQYYTWHFSSEFRDAIHQNGWGKVIQLSNAQREIVNDLKSKFVRDDQLSHKMFMSGSCDETEIRAEESFRWSSFSMAVTACESYKLKLHEDMQRSLPYWKAHESIFHVAFGQS